MLSKIKIADPPDTSQQADGSQRISPGQDGGQKTGSSSHTLLAGPSETAPLSCESKTLFHPGSNPDTESSLQEREEHSRRLSSEGAIRKRNFHVRDWYSDEDDSSEDNLKVVETKSPEESVRDSDASVVDAATSTQSCPGTSPKEVEGDSPGEATHVKNSEKFNLGFTPWSFKSEAFFHPGSNPGAEGSRQEREEHRSRLSSEGAIRKRNFLVRDWYSDEEDSSEDNLKALKTKSPEESAQDNDVSVADTDTSSLNRSGKSPKAGDCKGSVIPEEQEPRESSSTSGLEKGIAQCNLDPSKTISCSPKPETIGLEIRSSEESVRDADVCMVDAATSPQRRPGTSPKEVAEDSPEEATHVKKSEQLNLGFTPWSFKSEAFLHPGSNLDTEASRQGREEHRSRLSSEGAIRKRNFHVRDWYSDEDDSSEDNLKALETKSPEESVRDSDVYVADSATSPHNRPGTTPKEDAGDGKGAIGPEEPPHVEYFEPWNLGISPWSFHNELFKIIGDKYKFPRPKPDAGARPQEYEERRRRWEQFSEKHLRPLEETTRAATSSQNRPGAKPEETTDLDVSAIDAATSGPNSPGTRPGEATDGKESTSSRSAFLAAFVEAILGPPDTESSNEASN